MNVPPRLLLTLGDVAGIGPEVIVRALQQPEIYERCRPVVVGDVARLKRTLADLRLPGEIQPVRKIDDAGSTLGRMACLQASDQDLHAVEYGQVSAAAGRAAYDFLCQAIDLALAGQADGIVTAPLHKEGLHAAGIPYPGHTEILAERTRTRRFAMMLYCQGEGRKAKGERVRAEQALGVTHVTLHLPLRDVFARLNPESVLEKIELTDTMLTCLLDPVGRTDLKSVPRPRIGVCGLNPHASDGGLFGHEEREIITPAVETAQRRGIQASGPWPSDTLFARAFAGEFDGIVAMYHDQGHIAMKLVAGRRAVNISLGLPVVRTSVAHGTAYDIAGKSSADPTSMIEAIRVAARLARNRGDQ